ncbi:MAG: hypothetical protein AAGF82_21250 [Pseudomonadota bacterium]
MARSLSRSRATDFMRVFSVSRERMGATSEKIVPVTATMASSPARNWLDASVSRSMLPP